MSARLLWLAWAVAASPVVVDLLVHQLQHPPARYALLFAPLLWLQLRRDGAPGPPARDGLWWLGLGIAMELVFLGAGMTRLARPWVWLSAFGLARWTGRGRAGTWILALFLIPLPSQLARMQSPWLETLHAHVARLLLEPLGATLSVVTAYPWTFLETDAARLVLEAPDGGLSLVCLAAGLGWYASLRRGARLTEAGRRAAVWAACALPAQALAVTLAAAVLASGSEALARGLLTHVPWLLVAALGVWVAETGARSDLGGFPRGFGSECHPFPSTGHPRGERHSSREQPAGGS
ncbi:MAG: hypothetical protein MJE66_19515 [Proteobacteria bacterium]|nr:hypothetical protein [Pseudomonadota bacterium]